MFSCVSLMHTQYLCSMSVPAQVLREAVEADIVGLTLRPRRAEGQAVIVLLHLLHLQGNTHKSDITVGITDMSDLLLNLNDNPTPVEIES